ncbi:hypothetical protein J2X97_003562 [Epilithonimonas hungarica]|nr:hypothetical protein [Epilithonimonas hungarica]
MIAVESNDMVTNNPSELIIVIPDMASGTYTLEVLTQFSGTQMLKESRMASFDKILTAQ